MKKLFRNIALFAATAVAAVGCAPEQGEIIDTIELNRALTPLEFKASVIASKGTDVEFSWEAMEGTEKYTLQLFAAAEDAEGNTVAPNYDEASPIETYIVLPEEIPFVVENLPVDESFYARVKGHKTNVEDSHWAVLEEDFSTYPVRSNLYPKAIERGTDYIVIEWNAAEDKADLTSVRVAPVMGGEEKVVALESADKNACNKKVEGLVACTNYRIELIYGKAGSRGITTAWTRPSTEGTNLVNAADQIINALTGTIGPVKLRLAYNDGVPYDLSSVASIQCEPTFIGETTADGKKPVISGLQVISTGKVFHMEDIYFDGAGQISLLQNDAPADAPATIEFINCEITGYERSLYVSNSTGSTEKFLLDGVYLHDINPEGASGGDLIDFRKGTHKDIRLQNSTFYDSGRTFMRLFNSKDLQVEKVNIVNCTFNMVTSTKSSSNNQGIVGWKTESAANATEFNISKCVFLNQFHDNEDKADASKSWVRIARNSTDSYAPTCSGNYYYNVGAAWFTVGSTNLAGETFSEAAALAEGGQILTEDPCVNSLANKLYLNTTSDISAKKVGDPRWWNAQQPIVVRATELTLESEPRVWDFTVKSKFDTETLEKATIIDNVRIYATAEVPAEVVMGEGVKFSKGAMVNAEGEPEYSAVGVLTEGYGAIVVTAQGATGIETMQVLAGGDRYTILADGEPHKVVLGDLAGENNIYVLASSAVTLTKVEWTKDLTPDQTVFPLAKPTITLSATSLDEGTAEAVTVSWAAVENAATYVLTGLGQSLTFTADQPLELTVPAEQVAVLPVGEYEITLTAYPVETSSKYSASETATATFKIKEVVLGAPVTLTWDFSSDAWASAIAAIGTSNNTEVNLTVDGLSVQSGGGSIKTYDTGRDEFKWAIQHGGKGSATKRYFQFTAPASGTLKVWSSNSSGEDLTRLVTVQYGADGEMMQNPGGSPSGDAPTVSEFDIDITKGNDIRIWSDGNGLRYYKIEYTYVAAAPAKNHWVWNINEMFTAKADLVNNVGKDMMIKDGAVVDISGNPEPGYLYLSDQTKKISIRNNGDNTADGCSYFSMTYSSGNAYTYFYTDKPGTLTLKAGHGKDATADCKIAIYTNGGPKDGGVIISEQVAVEPLDLTKPLNGAGTYTFEIKDITEMTKICIGKPGGSTSPDLYVIEFEEE
ncbi:MAG: DUF4957 domain-containing protein [Tidjanibacter sp.]|nr:DUF4957 domain-containing protein [Tidjanibacter sp.]